MLKAKLRVLRVAKEFEGGEGKTEGGERPIGQQKNEQRIIKEKT